jgi:hypothetical protein
VQQLRDLDATAVDFQTSGDGLAEAWPDTGTPLRDSKSNVNFIRQRGFDYV